MKKGYTAYNLTEASRAKLLSVFNPKFTTVVAHHVTFAFGVNESEPIPDYTQLKVIGHAANENIECVVVEIGGTSTRPDGKTYHITLSHNDKAKPVDSNALLVSGYQRVTPFNLEVKPTFNPFS